MISGVICDYKEFRLIDGKWKTTDSQRYLCEYNAIMACIEATQYFGGSTHVTWKRNRRFGLVPVHYEVTSACGMVKRIYDYNYNHTKSWETVQ